MYCLVYACFVILFFGYYLGGLKPKPVSAGILDDLLMPPLLFVFFFSGTSQYMVLYMVYFFVFVVVDVAVSCISSKFRYERFV